MPVVLLGGQPFLARAVALAMSAVSPEVRALTPKGADADALRRVGVKVAVGSSSDAELLDAVLTGAHTVCLLGSSGRSWLTSLPDETVGRVAPPLERARLARVQRVLQISLPGADTDAPAALLRAAALAEQAVAGSGIPHAIIRSNLVYGRGSEFWIALRDLARARPARVIGTGTQRWAPVHVDDLAKVMAMADNRADLVSGIWGLNGPDVVVVDELVDLLAGRRPTIRRRVRVGGRTGSVRERRWSFPDAMLEWLSGDIVAGAPDAAEEFGVELTPLREGIARSFGG
jgi:uncharacterized protein YbjT (DUF2867 family)